MFKQCGLCNEIWMNYNDFLSDPQLKLIGYQASFDELETGLFMFHHTCKNTLAIPTRDLTCLYDGPIFQERATGTDECPEYCLQQYNLDPCPVECECAYVREVLQIAKKWPKKNGQSF